jgi:hypothetical protein
MKRLRTRKFLDLYFQVAFRLEWKYREIKRPDKSHNIFLLIFNT